MQAELKKNNLTFLCKDGLETGKRVETAEIVWHATQGPELESKRTCQREILKDRLISLDNSYGLNPVLSKIHMLKS